jgi:hypothetical protein
MRYRNSLTISAMFTTAVLAMTVVSSGSLAADAPTGTRPARLEKVEGSDIPKVILLEQAATRLGIETSEVREEAAKRWVVRIGRVEPAARGEPGPSINNITSTGSISNAAMSPMWIRVPADGDGALNSPRALLVISQGNSEAADDYADADDDGGDNDDDTKVVTVIPIGAAPATKRYKARPVEATAGLKASGLFFEPISTDAALTLGQKVFVRQPGGGANAMVVPYSAVIYDVKGDSWLYTNPKPLEFARQKIVIERILGDVAVLSDGPPAGTQIVSVGAAELMGVEQKVGN